MLLQQDLKQMEQPPPQRSRLVPPRLSIETVAAVKPRSPKSYGTEA
jgi:hypothetical protein